MGGMWLWWILGIAMVGALAWVVVGPLSRANSESAEELLKRRYACGEIDNEEFEKRLQDLRK